jgi:hypothetical protein
LDLILEIDIGVQQFVNIWRIRTRRARYEGPTGIATIVMDAAMSHKGQAR